MHTLQPHSKTDRRERPGRRRITSDGINRPAPTQRAHRPDTYNGRTYSTRMATNMSGARCAGCAHTGRTPPVRVRPPSTPPPLAQRRHAPPCDLDDASSQGHDGAPTSASTPLPACPAVAEPRATRVVIVLDLPAHHTDWGWSAPTQISARRRPADSRMPRAVHIDEAPFAPPGRPLDRARPLLRVGRHPLDACGRPAREDAALPAGSERAWLQNRPVRGRKGGGWDRRCAQRRRQGAEGRRTSLEERPRDHRRWGCQKKSNRSSTRKSSWPTPGRS